VNQNFCFYYLIAAHNEEGGISVLVSQLDVLAQRFPGFRAYIVENGSDDQTSSALLKESRSREWLHILSIPEKGLGYAFRAGLRKISEDLKGNEPPPPDISRWIVFTAADLPFGFSDLDSFLKMQNQGGGGGVSGVPLFVGSKSHRHSQVNRGISRTLGSWIFRILRTGLLSMKTQDPNGTLFLRSDYLPQAQKVLSNDYFFTTETVYFIEQIAQVREMPVTLRPNLRASKVRIGRDGWKMLQQIWRLRSRIW